MSYNSKLTINCTLGTCKDINIINNGGILKIIAPSSNDNGIFNNAFDNFIGYNYNISNITVLGCNYTLNICDNMSWYLYDYSNMNYINNINQNPIYLFNQSKCNICTGNIISKSPTFQPTLNPTNNPSKYPSLQPTQSPTTGFPLCSTQDVCREQVFHTNETYRIQLKSL